MYCIAYRIPTGLVLSILSVQFYGSGLFETDLGILITVFCLSLSF